MKQQLSDEQQLIVDEWTQNGGAIIVNASAGSGKTRVLTECVRALLEESLKEKFQILCMTFTVKSAEEMQERLKTVKGIKDRTYISNLHTFALRILKSYRRELGYTEMPHVIENRNDQKAILKQVFAENPDLMEAYLVGKDKKSQEKLIDITLNVIADGKKRLFFTDADTFQYQLENHDEDKHKLLFMFKDYNDRLRNQNLIDYDDMLLLAWRILTEKPHVARIYQRLYKYVLIDEGQDLSYAQYQLIKALCGDEIKNILMVGDRNQSINGFAGADKKYMFEYFKNEFNADERQITENYRSSKSVLQVANLIIEGKHKINDNQHFIGNFQPMEFENERQEAEWIINKIHETLTWEDEQFEGKVTLEKIAILARNKYVFNELKNVLNEDEDLKNNYFVKQGADTLAPESNFMKIFDLGTRIVTNPNGKVYLRSLYNVLKIKKQDLPSNGISKTGLEILTNLKKYIPENSNIDTLTYSVLIDSWTRLNDNIKHFTTILNALKTHTDNLDEKERANAILDIEEWQQAWKKYIRNSSASHKSLADFKRFIALGYTKVNKEQGLTLATVHTTKGLEYDIVFLMGMCEGTFPDYRANTPQAIEEERNNAYVAVTRAKRHLYITYPKNKMMPWGSSRFQQKSRFIKPIFEVQTV